MDRQRVLAGFLTFVILASGIYFFMKLKKPKVEGGPELFVEERIRNFQPNANLKCPSEEIDFTVNDNNMAGLIEAGQKVKVLINYYACNKVEKDDVVFFRFSETMDPVIRRVVAVGGDVVKLSKDVKHKGWNLSVNDSVVKVNNEPWFFGVSHVAPPLQLGLEPRKNKLRENDLVILGTIPPGNKDSGLLGVVSRGDAIGKVEIAKNSEPKGGN